MRKRVPLNESTGVGRGFFVRHLQMFSIIRLPGLAGRLVCIDPEVQAVGLVDFYEATSEHYEDAAFRLGPWIPNVWLGMTAENQVYFDQRWGILQNIPAWLKFVSYDRRLGRCGCPKPGLCRTG